jgi:hypothetical protein
VVVRVGAGGNPTVTLIGKGLAAQWRAATVEVEPMVYADASVEQSARITIAIIVPTEKGSFQEIR